MNDTLLSDVKVIDLTWYIAGPLCTKLLAGMGAQVIKVERPGAGDPSRDMGPFPQDIVDPEKSGTFLYLNTGKKSVTLDLKTETGRSIFKNLIKTADVLVENFEPKVMPGLSLSYETLAAINPRLVMTSISNFGQDGPYRDYKADEMVILALGGFLYLGGYPDREPLKLGFSASQYMGGLAGFSGTMAALHYAQKTGVGQHVDVSLMECILASHFQTIEQYAYTGQVAKRNRTMFVFPAKNGTVQFGMQPHHWPRMTQMLGMTELTNDPRFSTTGQRRIHADELEGIMLPWMLEHTVEEIYNLGQSLGLPVGYAATTADLFSSSQYKARGFFAEIDHPRAGSLAYPGAPLTMGDLQWMHERAPLLGEHNVDVYCGGLGYTKEELVLLRERHII